MFTVPVDSYDYDRRRNHLGCTTSHLKPSSWCILPPQNPLDPSSVKVYDFGLARVLDQQHPFATEDCGSLGYTAPELLRKEPYGVEVDLFSTGVILFFVLSGYRPFNMPGADRGVIKQRIMNCEYSMDRIRWSRVSKEAQNLVRSLLVQRDYRLNATEAVQHEWFREDEATLANHDLRGNATYIQTGAQLEPHWSDDTGGIVSGINVSTCKDVQSEFISYL